MTFLLFLSGTILLFIGAKILVYGMSRIAASAGISSTLIGLIIAAFGTSAPVFAVSISASLTGQTDIALGTVVGGGIFSILCILGITSLVVPLTISQRLIKKEIPLITGAAVLPFLFGVDGMLNRMDGWILLLGFVAYTFFILREYRNESDEITEEYEKHFGAQELMSRGNVLFTIGFMIAGVAVIMPGTRWLIDGAGGIAQNLGVSELIVGLSFAAAGASLPVLTATVIAGKRGERDIAVGILAGSVIFTALGSLGLSSVIAPRGIAVSSPALNFDMPFMIIASIGCLPIFFPGNKISRWQGVLFLGYYIVYIAFILFEAPRHDTLYEFTPILLYFLIPLVFLTLCVIIFRELALRRSSGSAIHERSNTNHGKPT